jgi:hypothetical protein
MNTVYSRYSTNPEPVLRLQPPVPINFRVATKDTSLPVGGGPDCQSPVYIKVCLQDPKTKNPLRLTKHPERYDGCLQRLRYASPNRPMG